MRTILTWLLVVMFMLVPGSSLSSYAKTIDTNVVGYTYMANELREHSVTMEAYSAKAGRWYRIGSGTLVEVGKNPNILTAWHVAEYAVEYPMRACPVLAEKNKCVYVVYPWASEMDNIGYTGDWALFQIVKAPDGMKPAKMRKRRASVGESIYTLTSPSVSEGLMGSGVLSKYDGTPGNYLYMTDAFVFYGSSGGGVYDANGQLIGIVVAVRVYDEQPIPHVNFAVPVTRVLNYLNNK